MCAIITNTGENQMTIQKGRLVGTSLVMALWFGMVHWMGPLIGFYPLIAARLNIILVVGTVAFMFYYRGKTTDTNEKKLLGRMLAYTAAGIVVALASNWALHQA